MYFLQEAGAPLKLEYAKTPYGPYAENLRHVLEVFLADKPEIRARFDRVADLVEGFESSFGLELLSSVHWVATREGASSPEEASRLVHAWNERKKRFLPEQIAIAWDILATKGWIRGRAS